MDFGNGLAEIGKLVLSRWGTRLTRRARLFFKLVVSLIGRSFVMECVRFLFVDSLFFQSSRSRKNRRLRLTCRRKRPVRRLGSRFDKFRVLFDKLLFNRLSVWVCGWPCRLRPAKFIV